MDLLSIILIGVGLAMDCLAVSTAQGLSERKWCAAALLMAVLFGVFQGGMPLIGYYAGMLFSSFFSRFAPWVALVLLCAIGGKMIWDSLHPDDNGQVAQWGITHLLLLAVATSIDALATGVIFIPYPDRVYLGGAVIALISFLFSLVGFVLGVRLGKLKVNVGLMGGLILIAIGIKICLKGVLS